MLKLVPNLALLVATAGVGLAGALYISGEPVAALYGVAFALLGALGRLVHPELGTRLLCYGGLAVLGGAALFLPVELFPHPLMLLWLPVLITGLLVPSRLLTVGLLAGGVLAAVAARWLFAGLPLFTLLSALIAHATSLGTALVLALFWVEAGRDDRHTRERRQRSQHAILTAASALAAGDLAVRIDVSTEEGRALAILRDRTTEVVLRVREVQEQLSLDAAEMDTTTSESARGAAALSAAVEQTRVILENLVKLSQRIAEVSHGVLSRAETVQRFHADVANSSSALASHGQRIRDLLADIQSVARKSEVLALNAALEGARAGDAGYGFELVGQEMKRLNQQVVATLTAARQLTDDIEDAAERSLSQSAHARGLASQNTGMARDITSTTQEQLSSVEQVRDAMEDIARVTEHAAQTNEIVSKKAQRLSRAASRMAELLDHFHS